MTPSSTAADDDGIADVAVVGAGIIGVACALMLRRQGHRVVVIDALEPGQGASYGNAGHLATEQVFPIADLSILRRVPGMLMDPTGPLRLDWRHLPRALPWFARLLLNLRPAAFERTVAGLRALNERSRDAWLRLLHSIDRPDLLRHDGSLLVFERQQSLPELRALQVRLHRQRVPVEFWDAPTVQATAPQLSERIRGGLFFPATGHFIDPHGVVEALVRAARTSGVRFLRRRVGGGTVHAQGVTLATDGDAVPARQVLVACGAHSAGLIAALTGRRVPLDTERGYHLMLPHEPGRLPFPVTSMERKFIMTPMAHGLRLAGTVEFAGLERPANMERAWQLERLARPLFRQDLDAGEATPWMGFRPSLPDSLPVIDSVCDGRVLIAMGHQHLGLTQAAVTAEAVSGLGHLSPRPRVVHGLPLEPYRLARF